MLSNPVNILVLGVGGNVSQGILKSLGRSNLTCRIIGACVSPLALGLYVADKSYVSPMANDDHFIDWLIDTCKREGVQAILSGVEPVLNVIAKYEKFIYSQTGAVCIVSSSEQLAIASNKFTTCQWLENNGFNFPKYAMAGDEMAIKKLSEEVSYPLIAKPCIGRGARGIINIYNLVDLTYASGLSNYVIQEYIGDPESEYTVGCFCDKIGQVRGTIAMRRDLLEGTTYRAEVVDIPELKFEAERIVSALRPVGPCNLQFRISSLGKPVCFEINLRFSGTTPLRAYFGFNDVEAAIRHYVLGEYIENLPLITEGVALRYWNEMYVEPKAVQTLRESNVLEEPRKYKPVVEDFGSN